MKTYVLDASALFSFLQGKGNALKVNELVKEAIRGRAQVLMSAVNYGEVYGTILREDGPEQARTALDVVAPLPIEVLDVTPKRARQAADLKVKYKLYFADSFAASLTLEYEATLATSDTDFRRLGHSFPVLWLRA
jgi:predicted nucleic acid-binding protein